MRVGVVFPQTEIGDEPAAIRAYAEAVEGMGYKHILVYDHVIGANTASRPDWRGPYNLETPFHEVFVLYGYLAAVTQQVELVIGVLVLPQRQTVLAAKQAAAVDVLSGGRLRLGVGVGWNAVEYEALNEDFYNRGARCDEQIALMRALWTKPAVTFKGHWHIVSDAGIKPLPVQRPIPVWVGGGSEAALRRAGRLGDGWFPQRPPDEQARTMIESLRQHASAAGRSPESIGLEPRLSLSQVPESGWTDFVEGWRQLGATHLCINSMGMGLASPQGHIDALRRAKEVLGF